MVRARGRGLPRKRRTAAIVERVLALALDKRIMLYDVSSMYVLYLTKVQLEKHARRRGVAFICT